MNKFKSLKVLSVLFLVFLLLLVGFDFLNAADRTVKILKNVTDTLNVAGNLIVNGKMGIGQSSPGAKLTVNNTTAVNEVGSAGDAIYAYASSTTSAIAVKQGNPFGYGIYSMANQNYFSGDLDVRGKITNAKLGRKNCYWKYTGSGNGGHTAYCDEGDYVAGVYWYMWSEHVDDEQVGVYCCKL